MGPYNWIQFMHQKLVHIWIWYHLESSIIFFIILNLIEIECWTLFTKQLLNGSKKHNRLLFSDGYRIPNDNTYSCIKNFKFHFFILLYNSYALYNKSLLANLHMASIKQAFKFIFKHNIVGVWRILVYKVD